MHIELRNEVIVRVSEGLFDKLPAGTKVNYSSEKRDNLVVHKFTFYHSKAQAILSHVTVTSNNENPPWL